MSSGSEWLTRVASNALQFINAPSTAEERMAAAAMAAIIVGGIAVVSRRRGRDDGLHEGGLSSRGTRTLRAHGDRAQAVIDRFGRIWGDAKADQYDPTANPSGWVVTMTAENKLSYGILEDALKQASLSVPATSAGYGEYRGIPRFRKALAAFFRAHVFTDDVAVDPEHFVISAGVASVVDAVFYNLIDDGDGVLVPTPCYSSHFRNMSIRSGARFVPVPSEENAFVVTPEMLSAAMALHSRRVHPKRIRGLLLTVCPLIGLYVITLFFPFRFNLYRTMCEDSIRLRDTLTCCMRSVILVHADRHHLIGNETILIRWTHLSRDRYLTLMLQNPNNPTGTIATIEDLRSIIRWCADNRVHLVSDEVYATSTFGGRAFVSVAQVARSMEDVDMDYVHAIWGLSKDFCMSGNRCGVLYSTNAKLVRAMEELGVSNGVGNFFQVRVCTPNLHSFTRGVPSSEFIATER